MSTSSTGWATSAGCPAPRSWCSRAWTRTPPRDQIAELLGRPPPPRLVEQVYRKVAGQPVLQRAAGTPRRPRLRRAARGPARRAQPGAAGRLAEHVSPGAGDRPHPGHRRPPRPNLRTLAAVAAELGVSEAGSVREAVDAGVVVLGGGEGVWFRHPLLAAVLAESYLPGEAAPVHAAWAAHLESFSAEGVDELRRLGDLASHHEQAGDGVGGVRRAPPRCRPRREARRASRGRRPAGPGGRPVGGGCRRHRHRRPCPAAGARRRGLPMGGAGTGGLSPAPRGT